MILGACMFFSHVVAADMSAFVGGGTSLKESKKSTGSIGLRKYYGKNMSGLLAGLKFEDWSGTGNLIKLDIGYRTPAWKRLFLDLSTGPAYLKTPDRINLSHNLQFESSAYLGFVLAKRHRIFGGYSHISNGNGLGFCSGDKCKPNRGLDFIKFGYEWAF